MRAYSDGCDVINLSLGGGEGWSESPASVVASAVSRAGRVVTVSQGNYGETGTFYASAPSAGKDVWAIGSVDNIGLTSFTATVSSHF